MKTYRQYLLVGTNPFETPSMPQPERLATLNGIAITQMRTLLNGNSMKRLK